MCKKTQQVKKRTLSCNSLIIIQMHQKINVDTRWRSPSFCPLSQNMQLEILTAFHLLGFLTHSHSSVKLLFLALANLVLLKFNFKWQDLCQDAFFAEADTSLPKIDRGWKCIYFSEVFNVFQNRYICICLTPCYSLCDNCLTGISRFLTSLPENKALLPVAIHVDTTYKYY